MEVNGHDNIILGLVSFVLMIGHIARNAVLNENLADLNFLSEMELTQLISFSLNSVLIFQHASSLRSLVSGCGSLEDFTCSLEINLTASDPW